MDWISEQINGVVERCVDRTLRDLCEVDDQINQLNSSIKSGAHIDANDAEETIAFCLQTTARSRSLIAYLYKKPELTQPLSPDYSMTMEDINTESILRSFAYISN